MHTPSPPSDAALDTIFRALADPTRRAMLRDLATGPRGATSFVTKVKMSQPAVSKHLRVLREAGLIRSVSRGRTRLCELRPERLLSARQWMDTYLRFWNEQLDALEAFVVSGTDDSTVSKTPRLSTPTARTTRNGSKPKTPLRRGGLPSPPPRRGEAPKTKARRLER